MFYTDLLVLYLSGTYCHKTGTSHPSCQSPRQPNKQRLRPHPDGTEQATENINQNKTQRYGEHEIPTEPNKHDVSQPNKCSNKDSRDLESIKH